MTYASDFGHAAGSPEYTGKDHITDADLKARYAIEPIRPYNWRVEAVCAQTDPEEFFPDKGAAVNAAKRLCLSCPVVDHCLKEAIADPSIDGVWGATTNRDRQQIRTGKITVAEAQRLKGRGPRVAA